MHAPPAQVAELGATENDWRSLAAAAAAALQLPVAAAAFQHLKDEPGQALVVRVGAAWRGGAGLDLCTADVLAYQVTVGSYRARPPALSFKMLILSLLSKFVILFLMLGCARSTIAKGRSCSSCCRED